MDVLKKELEEAFSTQHFTPASTDPQVVDECREQVRSLVSVSQGCAVLSDLASGKSYIHAGTLGSFLGLEGSANMQETIDSLDEDCIYQRMHPEDLVDKRMLELAFFRFLCQHEPGQRLDFHSVCNVRMRNKDGRYFRVVNRTQILRNTADGNMWLALCQYGLSAEQGNMPGIGARIINNGSGEVVPLSFVRERNLLLSEREREILLHIREGMLSKEIADRLSISVHTVNRHRQNILQKLSVSNSLEAVRAATEMRLL